MTTLLLTMTGRNVDPMALRPEWRNQPSSHGASTTKTAKGLQIASIARAGRWRGG